MTEDNHSQGNASSPQLQQSDVGENKKLPNRETDKLLALGMIVVISVVWGIYSPVWLKAANVKEWLFTPLGLTLSTLICVSAAAHGKKLLLKDYKNKARAVVSWFPIIFLLVITFSVEFEWKGIISGIWMLIALIVIFSPFVFRDQRSGKEEAKDDILGRSLLYQDFEQIVRRKHSLSSKRGIAIAIRGAWGSGKSHFINHLAYRLEKPCSCKNDTDYKIYVGEYAIVRIDVWKCISAEAFRRDVASALSMLVTQKNVYLNTKLSKIFTNIVEIFKPSTGTAFEEVFHMLTIGIEGENAPTSQFARRMRRMNKPSVLILDNLERCCLSLEEVLLPTIERLKDLPMLMTICGITYEKYSGSTKAENKLINSSILKVFDFVVPIPKSEKDYIKHFTKHYIASEKGLKCPLLMDWLEEKDYLKLETPREVVALVDSLGAIEQLYLQRLKFTMSDDVAEAGIGNNKNRLNLDAIFYISSLNVLYPDIALLLESANKPRDVICSWLCANVPTPPPNQQKPISSEVDSAVDCNTVNFARLVEIMTSLYEFKDDVLKFAINRQYLHLSILSDKDSETTIETWLANPISPRIHIISSLGLSPGDVEEPSIYDSVMQYALSEPYTPGGYKYVVSCICQDIIPDEGTFLSDYKSNEKFVFKCADLFYSIAESNDEDATYDDTCILFEKLISNLTLTAALRVTAFYSRCLTIDNLLELRNFEDFLCSSPALYSSFRRRLMLPLRNRESASYNFVSACFQKSIVARFKRLIDDMCLRRSHFAISFFSNWNDLSEESKDLVFQYIDCFLVNHPSVQAIDLIISFRNRLRLLIQKPKSADDQLLDSLMGFSVIWMRMCEPLCERSAINTFVYMGHGRRNYSLIRDFIDYYKANDEVPQSFIDKLREILKPILDLLESLISRR